MNDKVFKVGQIWKRSDGRLITILSTSAVGRAPIIGQLEVHHGATLAYYLVDGRAYYNSGDLIEEVKPRKTVIFWVNVYTTECGNRFSTKKAADECALKHRLACKKITFDYYEGEGLEKQT